MLGELPVQRTNAFYKYRSSLSDFCTSAFCKRSCLFCVLNSDTVVLDSEWHWIFDCDQFSSLRSKYPHFSTVLHSIREKSVQQNFSVDTDLRDLFRSIQDDSKCGFSLATFIRQATNARKEWLDSVCVRGRLCVPPSHWHRNIFSQPVAEAEVPADVASEFIFGKPWPISGLVR